MVQKRKVTQASKSSVTDYKVRGISPKLYGPVGLLVLTLFLIIPLPPTWYFGDSGFLIFGLGALFIISLFGRFRRH